MQWTGAPFRHVVCIPACDEETSLLETLHSLSRVAEAERTLVIVVINGCVEAEEALHARNQRGWDELACAAGLAEGPMSWGSLNGLGVLCIDRFREERQLPPKQGVGLARKIIGDVALALIASGGVESDWIVCTDADVDLPRNYLQCLPKNSDRHSAVIYPFEHVPEGDALQKQAMALYEAYLHFYVEGLRKAGSPYAFHTIGSLIGIQASAYAAVRGFPKRQAGEDFYLLNKLAKVGRVEALDGEPVRIRGRTSARVPFGTGIAVQEIREELKRGETYCVYNPDVFEGLRCWLSALEAYAEQPDRVSLPGLLEGISGPIGTALVAALRELKAVEAAEQAATQVSGAQLTRRLTEWNDAFRTLKLVHGLRDHGLGVLPLAEAREELEAWTPLS